MDAGDWRPQPMSAQDEHNDELETAYYARLLAERSLHPSPKRMTLLEEKPFTVFFGVLLVCGVAGGFIGAELRGGTFSAIDAASGALVVAVIIMALGWHFSRERKSTGRPSPELRVAMGRLVEKGALSTRADSSPKAAQQARAPRSPQEQLEATLGQVSAEFGSTPLVVLEPDLEFKRAILAEYINKSHLEMSAAGMNSGNVAEFLKTQPKRDAMLLRQQAQLARFGAEQLKSGIRAVSARSDFDDVVSQVRRRLPKYEQCDPLS